MQIDPTGRCGLLEMSTAPQGAKDAIYAVTDDGKVVGPLFFWDEATRWLGEAHYSPEDGEPSFAAGELIGWTLTKSLAEASQTQLLALWGEPA